MTWPGAIIQKAGEGMPNYDDNTRRGNLYITVDVDFPRGSFSDEDKEGLCVHVCEGGILTILLGHLSMSQHNDSLLRTNTPLSLL